MSASSDHDSASTGQKSRSAVSAETASEVRPKDRSNAIRRFVMGYMQISFWPLSHRKSPIEDTDNIRIVFGQDIIILFQHLGQSGIVGCFSLLQQPGEGHYALVVFAEALDQSLETLVCGSLVTGAET